MKILKLNEYTTEKINSIEDMIKEYEDSYNSPVNENDFNRDISDLRKKSKKLKVKLSEEKDSNKKQIVLHQLKINYYNTLILDIKKRM